MSSVGDSARADGRGRRRLFLLLSLGGPVVLAVLLAFGGERFHSPCGADGMCQVVRAPGPLPFAATREGAIWAGALTAAVWLVSLATLLIVTWRRDRRPAVRSMLLAIAATAVVGTLAFAASYAAHGRARLAAEDSVAAAAIVLGFSLLVGYRARLADRPKRVRPPELAVQRAALALLLLPVIALPLLALQVQVGTILNARSCGVSPGVCLPGYTVELPGIQVYAPDLLAAVLLAWVVSLALLLGVATGRDRTDLIMLVGAAVVGGLAGPLLGASSASVFDGAVVGSMVGLGLVMARVAATNPSSGRSTLRSPGD